MYKKHLSGNIALLSDSKPSQGLEEYKKLVQELINKQEELNKLHQKELTAYVDWRDARQVYEMWSANYRYLFSNTHDDGNKAYRGAMAPWDDKVENAKTILDEIQGLIKTTQAEQESLKEALGF